tara:strand:- start:2236 stop:3879 length:1644 start_codon:yes stop_codon:yes gene_type:complete
VNLPKRLLIYVVSFVTLNIFAFGLSSIIGWVFDLSGIIGDTQTQNIAPFIAAIIVCFPIWIFLWRFSKKNIKSFPEEEYSTLRNLYLNLVNGLSLIFISLSTFGFIDSILKFDSPLSSLPNLIVWIPILFIHLKSAQLEWESGRKRIHEFYLNLTFIISIIIIFISSANIISNIIDSLLIITIADDLITGGTSGFSIESGNIAAFMTSFILWYYSWFLRIKKVDLNFRTVDISIITISQVFIFLVSIFAIITQFILLIFDIGGDTKESAYKKIEFLPQLIGISAVSIIIWAYYSSGFLKTKIKKLYDIKSNSIKWVYRYSFKAISVIFLFLSSVTFFTFILGIPVTLSEQNLIPSKTDWEFQYLSASISSLIIGILSFIYINLKISNDRDEYEHGVQRSYIYIVGIIFSFMLIGSLITILTIFIRDFISWSFGISSLETMRLPLSFVFNSGLILIIYRNDIKNRLKNNEDFVINKNKLKVYSLNNLEEYKGLLSEKFDIESWGKYKEFSKFKLNKKGLEDLIIKINLLENKEYVIFESEDNNIYLYY